MGAVACGIIWVRSHTDSKVTRYVFIGGGILLSNPVSDSLQTRDYFNATASNWNTSAHSTLWHVALYKDRQSNRRVGVF